MRTRLPFAVALLLAASVGCDGSLTRDLIVRYQADEPSHPSGHDIQVDPRLLPDVINVIDSIATAHGMTRMEHGSFGGLPAWGKPVLLDGGARSNLSIEINIRSSSELRITVALFLTGQESSEMAAVVRELSTALVKPVPENECKLSDSTRRSIINIVPTPLSFLHLVRTLL